MITVTIVYAYTTGAKINEAGKHLGKLGEQAGRMSGSGHSGGAELNINPHRE